MRGGGIEILDALAAAAVVLAIASFIWFVEALGKEWSKMIETWPVDDESDTFAQALVPELAAARNVPEYRGACTCAACRKRPSEPCSDYDGD